MFLISEEQLRELLAEAMYSDSNFCISEVIDSIIEDFKNNKNSQNVESRSQIKRISSQISDKS